MSELTLEVFDTDDARRIDTLRVLAQPVTDNHRWETGGEFRQLFASLSNTAGDVCGGILSYTHGVWLDIEFVWVAEPIRRRGHGTRLLAAVEEEARIRGCRRAYLDTGASLS